jgi:hypothetical protein
VSILDDQGTQGQTRKPVVFEDPLGVFGRNAFLPWEFIHFNLPYRRPAEIVWTDVLYTAIANNAAGTVFESVPV